MQDPDPCSVLAFKGPALCSFLTFFPLGPPASIIVCAWCWLQLMKHPTSALQMNSSMTRFLSDARFAGACHETYSPPAIPPAPSQPSYPPPVHHPLPNEPPTAYLWPPPSHPSQPHPPPKHTPAPQPPPRQDYQPRRTPPCATPPETGSSPAVSGPPPCAPPATTSPVRRRPTAGRCACG